MTSPNPTVDHYPFVIQEHQDAAGTHWDLMLQSPSDETKDDRILVTWKFSVPPRPKSLAHPLPARALANHRRHYLDYEGPISNNRGRCRIVDRGIFELITRRSDLWVVRFSGQVLVGKFTLSKIGDPDVWVMTPAHEKEAQDGGETH